MQGCVANSESLDMLYQNTIFVNVSFLLQFYSMNVHFSCLHDKLNRDPCGVTIPVGMVLFW